jgi:hypothetical protein
VTDYSNFIYKKEENRNYARNTLPYTLVDGIWNKNGKKKNMSKDKLTKQ